jgi:hypothetical protein
MKSSAFDTFNWRWAFYINLSKILHLVSYYVETDNGLVIGGVFFPVYLFLLPPFDPQPKSESLLKRGKNFDLLGAALSIGAIMCLVMGINFGGTLYAWNSGKIIALFVVAGILFNAFAIQQHFAWLTTTSERMFPTHFLKIIEADLLFVAAAGCNAAGFIPIYYIPVYFQFTRGDTAIQAAVRLLPLITLLSAAIMANGYFMSKLGHYQPWYLIGSALALAGNVLLCKCMMGVLLIEAKVVSQLALIPLRVPAAFMATKFSLLSDRALSSRYVLHPSFVQDGL